MNKKEIKTLVNSYCETVTSESFGSDLGMLKHFKSTIGYVVTTESGHWIALEKPRIQKDFCFGYSLSKYDSESYDNANKMASHAATSEEYFIEANMKEINEIIHRLKENEYDLYSRPNYYTHATETKIYNCEYYKPWQKEYGEVPKDCEALTETDRMGLISGYEYLKADFEKRLKTYLKRYGLSKVNSWSYWQDE